MTADGGRAPRSPDDVLLDGIRIAMVAGRISVPPSYFLLDIADQLRPTVDVRLLAHRVVLTRDAREAIGGVVTERRLPTGLLGSLVRLEPDVVHQHWATWSTPARLAARRLGCPLIVSVHGYDAFLPPSSGVGASLRDRVKRRDRDHALAAASYVVVNSAFMADAVAALGVPGPRLRLIRHAIDTQAFTPGPAGERSGLLYVGRLSPEKGVPLLLDALALLPPASYGSLTVVGSGPDEALLRRRATDLGLAVRFVGQQPRRRVIDLLRRSRALVVPSVPARGQVEASGLAPLEGQACGTPVVVTSVGGLAENLPDDGRDLVARPDPESLAAAIARALDLDPDRASALLRRHVEEHHSLPTLRRSYLRLYAECLGHSLT